MYLKLYWWIVLVFNIIESVNRLYLVLFCFRLVNVKIEVFLKRNMEINNFLVLVCVRVF